MCDHKLLIEKFSEHRQVHERFLEMFATLLETAQSMKSLAADVTRHYDDLFVQLYQEPTPRSSPEPPALKRRKAHSFDSPSVLRPDVAYAEVIDSSMVRNKSDPEVSYSILNQNIDLPDSEESFFALTQSPTVREPLSPRRDVVENVQSTPPRPKDLHKVDQQEENRSEKKRNKFNLSLGRFSTNFKMSPETRKQVEQLPVRQKMTTPKVKVEQQENLAPVGKWTAKKTSTNVGRMESTLKKTPTSATKDSVSLLNRTRLRQTKLRFPDNKSSTDDNETYFEEFVQPSPTSFNGSRFMKSMKKKEQSSLIGAQSTANADDVFKSPEPKAWKPPKPAVDSDDDNFDIDQTYFSEAEKDLSRGRQVATAAKVKPEPSSQGKQRRGNILAMTTPAQIENPDMSGVEIIKPRSQDVITIEESQPTEADLLMQAIREKQLLEQASRKTILDAMGPPPSTVRKAPENPYPFRSSPLRKFATIGGPSVAPPLPVERRCTNCTNRYHIMVQRGLSPDEIRPKMPRNCRECRQVQLHETPPGFWNPEISPTQ